MVWFWGSTWVPNTEDTIILGGIVYVNILLTLFSDGYKVVTSSVHTCNYRVFIWDCYTEIVNYIYNSQYSKKLSLILVLIVGIDDNYLFIAN